jgi:hypothetical protein
MPDEDPKLTDEELRALEALPREAVPPPGLEDRIVAELRRSGHLSRARTGWGAAVAAGLFVAGLGLGLGVGRGSGPAPPAPTRGALFLLLLYDGGAPRDRPPEQEAALVAEHRAWAAELRRAGRLVSAEKLAPDARLLGGGGADSALPEALGYFLVRAPSLQDALAIARGCPHLRHGGRVAVQAIAAT